MSSISALFSFESTHGNPFFAMQDEPTFLGKEVHPGLAVGSKSNRHAHSMAILGEVTCSEIWQLCISPGYNGLMLMIRRLLWSLDCWFLVVGNGLFSKHIHMDIHIDMHMSIHIYPYRYPYLSIVCIICFTKTPLPPRLHIVLPQLVSTGFPLILRCLDPPRKQWKTG